MRFRRQKTLNEAATLLREHGYDVHGASGLDAIAASLSHFQNRPLPISRWERWEMLAAFVGKPAAYAERRAAEVTKKVDLREAKKKRGAAADFFESDAWMRLRYQVLKERGAKCECCGATRTDGVVIQVDHIRPRSLFPELALTKSNMQVLCRPCNLGKSNRDDTDWRDGQTLQ